MSIYTFSASSTVTTELPLSSFGGVYASGWIAPTIPTPSPVTINGHDVLGVWWQGILYPVISSDVFIVLIDGDVPADFITTLSFVTGQGDPVTFSINDVYPIVHLCGQVSYPPGQYSDVPLATWFLWVVDGGPLPTDYPFPQDFIATFTITTNSPSPPSPTGVGGNILTVSVGLPYGYIGIPKTGIPGI